MGIITEEGLMMKFEFHGGFEVEPNILDVKNPILAFSHGFDTDYWREVKRMLIKLFGPTDETQQLANHDYLHAFTRSGEAFHLRVFKIFELPSSEKKSMKLEHVSPVFTLKPLEIHRRDVRGGSNEYNLVHIFFDENQFIFAESGISFNLDEHSVYSGSSSQPAVLHVVHNANSAGLMLPILTNRLWLGYNTSSKEFFERYHVLRTVPVPGKGDTHDVLTRPLRAYMRSLVVEVGEPFGRQCCYKDFTEDNIFLRRGKVAIVGVKQERYTVKQAKENIQSILTILMNKVNVMPSELLFSAYYFLLEMVNKNCPDPRVVYPSLVNSFSWMEELDQNHMICDLYVEFMTFLDPVDQMAVARKFPRIADWEDVFDTNKLLHDVRVYNIEDIASD